LTDVILFPIGPISVGHPAEPISPSVFGQDLNA
jgi:hypothetical protein